MVEQEAVRLREAVEGAPQVSKYPVERETILALLDRIEALEGALRPFALPEGGKATFNAEHCRHAARTLNGASNAE